MEGSDSRRRRIALVVGGVATVFAAAVAVNYYARAQQDTPRGRFEQGCVAGCAETGAPKASCRTVCACLVADLETGRTEAELDQLLTRLDTAAEGSPDLDELKASHERCVSEVGGS